MHPWKQNPLDIRQPYVNVDDRFEDALAVEEGHTGLIKLVRQLQGEGLIQTEIHALLKQHMLALRSQSREMDEDRVADVMDFIVGWCSPHMQLVSDDLANNLNQHKQKEGD